MKDLVISGSDEYYFDTNSSNIAMVGSGQNQ